MRRLIVFCCLAMVGTCVLAEAASAQLLPRVRARRDAQIRAQVYGQVSRDVNARLNAQMAAATANLQETAEQQVASEAEKLAAQVEVEVAKLQAEVQRLVSQEAEKLAGQAAEAILTLRTEANANVEAEAQRLREQTEQQLVQLREENETKLQSTVASLNEGIAKALAEATATLPEHVTAEVTRQTDRIRADLREELVALQNDVAQAPEPEEPVAPQEQQQAIQAQPVRGIEEEASADGDDEPSA